MVMRFNLIAHCIQTWKICFLRHMQPLKKVERTQGSPDFFCRTIFPQILPCQTLTSASALGITVSIFLQNNSSFNNPVTGTIQKGDSVNRFRCTIGASRSRTRSVQKCLGNGVSFLRSIHCPGRRLAVRPQKLTAAPYRAAAKIKWICYCPCHFIIAQLW